MDQAVARRVWLEACERVKDQTMHPSLWRALEVAHGITLEDDIFVVGFTAANFPQSGLLRSAEHKSLIEKCLAKVLGMAVVRLKTVEGTSISDYENVKRQEAAFEAARRAIIERKVVQRANEHSWDEVLETVSRMYSKLTLRQLPQVRAQYMKEALTILSQAMDARQYDHGVDEASERGLARVLEKIATVTDTPSALVAIELFKMREKK